MSRLHYCKRLLLLISRHTVPKNFVMPYGILIDSAAIAGIALHGVIDTVLDLLNDSHMIRFSVLCAGRTFIIPIKEDNHTGYRLGRTVKPLSSVFEPLHKRVHFGHPKSEIFIKFLKIFLCRFNRFADRTVISTFLYGYFTTALSLNDKLIQSSFLSWFRH